MTTTHNVYNAKALLQAYIDSQHYESSATFRDYYANLVEILQTLFEVRLNKETFDRKDKERSHHDSWTYFRNIVSEYLKIYNAEQVNSWSAVDWFYDDKVTHARKAVFAAVSSLKASYLEMLLVILEQVYGQIDTVVDSEELRKLGFDDSTKPSYYED